MTELQNVYEDAQIPLIHRYLLAAQIHCDERVFVSKGEVSPAREAIRRWCKPSFAPLRIVSRMNVNCRGGLS